MIDLPYCSVRLPDWDLECWGVPDHSGPHQGGNFEIHRMGIWGAGVPTHVVRMPEPDEAAS